MPRAASTGFPRTRSATWRSRRLEERRYLPFAIASMVPYLLLLGRGGCGGARRLRLLGLAHVAAEGAGQGELSQLVADHVLGDEYRHEGLPVVDRDGVAHEVRGDRGAAAPGLDGGLFGGRAHVLHLLEEVGVDERALFQ